MEHEEAFRDEIVIKWKYRSKSEFQKEYVYEQKITRKKGQFVVPEFSAGTYFSNLRNMEALFQIEQIEFPSSFKNLAFQWKNILLDNKVDPNTNCIIRDDEYNRLITLFYDAIGFLAYGVMRFYRDSVEEIFQKKEVLNEVNIINSAINTSIFYKQDDSEYDILKNLINKYANKDNLLEDYKENQHRCFAIFIPNTKMYYPNNKFYTFSGYTDILDNELRKLLGIKGCKKFIRIIQAICDENQADLITLNRGVKLYHIKRKGQATQGLSLGDFLKVGHAPDIKNDYCCCERKIFGFFEDEMPDGRLIVKFKMCDRCRKGLWYQYQNGSIIKVEEVLIGI